MIVVDYQKLISCDWGRFTHWLTHGKLNSVETPIYSFPDTSKFSMEKKVCNCVHNCFVKLTCSTLIFFNKKPLEKIGLKVS